MVMEFIFNPAKISKNPSIIFFEALFLSIISVFFSVFIFPKEYASIGVLLFITVGAIPVFAKLFSYSSYLFNYSESFFTRHKILFLEITYFFLGIFVAFVLLFFILGPTTKETVFSTQLGEIEGVTNLRQSITGQAIETKINSENNFTKVFKIVLFNNFNVIIRAALLSFFYGAGALFLIAWNASILATVISSEIFTSMGSITGIFGIFQGIIQSFINFLGYIPHGFPEMLSYFIISFAGAMLARDLMKGLFTTEFRWKVLVDILFMVSLSVFLLVLGAIIEASYFL
ncbi:MAG TPA: stage II sporulation protein M [archaeon]|nr:stage II sporulation protein M [archaeon]